MDADWFIKLFRAVEHRVYSEIGVIWIIERNTLNKIINFELIVSFYFHF
jgi:hypothetical protein